MAQDIKIAEGRQFHIIEPHHLWYLLVMIGAFLSGIALLILGPVIVFGIIGILILGIILFHYPYLGAVAYITFEYARLSAMIPGLYVLQVGKLIVLPTIGIMLVRYAVLRDIKIEYDKIYSLFISWLILAFISTMFAFDKSVALEATIDLAKWFAIVFMIVNLVNTKSKWQIFMWLFLLLNLKMSQFQLRSFHSGYESAENLRFFIQEGVGVGSGGFFNNANDFGIAMVVVAPLAFYLYKSVKSLALKIISGAFTLAFMTSIMVSGSRGAALGLFASLIAYWVKSKSKFTSLIVVVILAVGFWTAAPTAWKDRFISAKDYNEDKTASSRLRLWKAGIDMFIDHPLTGVGIYNFPVAWTTHYRPTGVGGATVVHNIFIEAASELGIGGLIVLVGVLVVLFKHNRRTRMLCKKNNIRDPWYINFSHALDCSLIGFVVHGSFLTVLYYPHLYILAALIVSLYYIVKRHVESRMIQMELLKA